MTLTTQGRKAEQPGTAPVNQEAAPPVDMSKYDPALVGAWRRFIDYDLSSAEQKITYQRLRQAIIILGALASTLAVFSTYLAPESVIRDLFRVALIILPVASVALMNYSAQFAASTHWVEYRVAGEIIRSQIYLYRLDAEKYRGKPPHEKQALLLSEVDKVDNWIQEQNIDRPQLQPINNRDLLQLLDRKTEGDDDGFKALSTDEYIQWRVSNQLDWYKGKIQEDRRMTRRNRVAAIIVAALGSVLAGIGLGLEGLVAATTATGAALTMISDVRMYGRTYRIYYDAACNLQFLLNQWSILPKAQQDENQKQFITNFEHVFDQERRDWREETIKTQVTSEQAIYSQVKQVAGNRTENVPPVAVGAVAPLPNVTVEAAALPTGIPFDAAPETSSSVAAANTGTPTVVEMPVESLPADAPEMVVSAAETTASDNHTPADAGTPVVAELPDELLTLDAPDGTVPSPTNGESDSAPDTDDNRTPRLKRKK